VAKYKSENCFENLNWQSVYIEEVKVENNNLFLTLACLVFVLVFYDFIVLDSGYYDCSHVQKHTVHFDKDCTYVEIPLLQLINNFTIVTEDIKDKNELFFEQKFEGFAWNFGEDTWGYFKLRYKRMEMIWDSFYNA